MLSRLRYEGNRVGSLLAGFPGERKEAPVIHVPATAAADEGGWV